MLTTENMRQKCFYLALNWFFFAHATKYTHKCRHLRNRSTNDMSSSQMELRSFYDLTLLSPLSNKLQEWEEWERIEDTTNGRSKLTRDSKTT